MPILLVTGDLMAISRLSGAAEGVGHPIAVVATLDALGEALDDGNVSLVILDLAGTSLEASQIVAQVRQSAEPAPPIVAFGPHVQHQQLTAATEAGCDEVFSRGQFHAQTADILQRYCR